MLVQALSSKVTPPSPSTQKISTGLPMELVSVTQPFSSLLPPANVTLLMSSGFRRYSRFQTE